MNFPDLASAPVIAIDCETDGLGRGNMPFGVSVACAKKSGETFSGYWDLRQCPQVVPWLRETIRRASGTTWVAHNLSFDYRMLASIGVLLPLERCDDTVIRACLIDEHLMSYALDDLARKYLGERKSGDELYEQMAALLGGKATRNVQMKRIAEAPVAMVAPYAIKDAELVLRLYDWQEKEIARQGIQKIVQFERELMPTFIRAQQHGVRVDVDAARVAQDQLTIDIDMAQRELEDIFGRPIAVNSPKQVRELFRPTRDGSGWRVGDFEIPSTGGGAPSMGAETLRSMVGDRRAELVLEIRSNIKTCEVFLGGHVIGSAYQGRVYPTINQTKGERGGTSSGRISYQSPALQQLPSRGGRAVQLIKSAFLPDEGQKWVSYDMNSFEVRVAAHYFNSEQINAAYAADELTDFHAQVAEMTGLPRTAKYSGQPNAKQLSLSMIFGSGNGAIAAKMGMPWTPASFTADDGEEVSYRKAGPEAMKVIERYHEALPGVRAFMAQAKQVIKSRGFLRTPYGRRLRCPDLAFSYKMHGVLIQAASADISKTGWRDFSTIAETGGGKLLLGVHDSFEFSMPEECDPVELRAQLQEQVRAANPWIKIPLVLDINGSGVNYYEATKK